MFPRHTPETRARLRTRLTIAYALLIVYASLSPFTGWREQGLRFTDVIEMPLRLTYTPFDATANLLAYLPFGFLVCSVFRAQVGRIPSVMLALLAGMSLSACMELLQMYLPTRTSSNMDLLTNSTGTLTGALLAAAMTSRGRLVAKLAYWRSGLFQDGEKTDSGLVLLAIWAFGQTNPSLPMLGHIFISETARQPFANPAPVPFNWWIGSAVILNLLMLGTLMLTLLRAPRNAPAASLAMLGAVALMKFLAAALLLKSWALFLWINREAAAGMLAGMLLLPVVVRMPRSTALLSGAAAALGHFIIVNFAIGNNPPPAPSVYQWHYGHLPTYNGLAQTITLIFPVLLLFHLWRTRTV